jgi:hypothetical protein
MTAGNSSLLLPLLFPVGILLGDLLDDHFWISSTVFFFGNLKSPLPSSDWGDHEPLGETCAHVGPRLA